MHNIAALQRRRRDAHHHCGVQHIRSGAQVPTHIQTLSPTLRTRTVTFMSPAALKLAPTLVPTLASADAPTEPSHMPTDESSYAPSQVCIAYRMA
jgi:hypothetical protein